MKNILLIVTATLLITTFISIAWANDLEIKGGILLKNGRPFFLFGGMPPAKFADKFQGLNLIGLESDTEKIFPEGQESKFNGENMKLKITENRKSKIFTDILWGPPFPNWAKKKWSQELNGGTGWFKYNISAPVAKDLSKSALNILLDRLKPACPFSIDLANEPAFNGNFYETAKNWRLWLENQYNSIDNMNEVWKTNHSGFSAIDVPDFVATKWSRPFNVIQSPLPEKILPVYHDWTIFNRWRVAKWFKELSDTVRRKSPQTKIHVKMIPNSFFRIDWGISPIDIVEMSDFAGCDTWTYYIGSGRWAFEWQNTWMWLDMLGSINPRKPIFNSENHFFRDDKNKPGSWVSPAPEEYLYAVLWGQAIHGQYATLIWGRWPAGNVQDRPEAVRGIQKAINDINRLSETTSLLSSVKPKVAILFSTSTTIAESAKMSGKEKRQNKSSYIDIMRTVYEGLITHGIPIFFVYEERPMEQQLGSNNILIISGVTHIHRSSFNKISDLSDKGIKVIILNSPILFDEYGKSLNITNFLKQKNVIQAKTSENIINSIKKIQTNEINVYEDGKESVDIEWRYAKKENDFYMFLLNHSNKVKNVSIKAKNIEKAINLISNENMDLNKIILQPLDVKVIKMTR